MRNRKGTMEDMTALIKKEINDNGRAIVEVSSDGIYSNAGEIVEKFSYNCGGLMARDTRSHDHGDQVAGKKDPRAALSNLEFYLKGSDLETSEPDEKGRVVISKISASEYRQGSAYSVSETPSEYEGGARSELERGVDATVLGDIGY